METFSVFMMMSSNANIFALLAIRAGNSPVTGEFPAQKPVTRCFDIFFDLHMNKRLSNRSWGWWFETLSHQFWRPCNVLALCAGNSPVTGQFPVQMPVTRGFGVFFDLRMNKRLSKQSEAGDLRHYRAQYNVTVMILFFNSFIVSKSTNNHIFKYCIIKIRLHRFAI